VTSSLDSSTHPAASGPVSASQRRFVDVFDDQYRSMVQIARLTTGSNDMAEDLVQDAFADLYRRYDDVRSPDAYLRRAVISRCTSWVRRRATERRYLDRTRPEPPATIDVDDLEVFDAVSALPVRQRTAIVLRYFADWSEADIAAALRCRPGTVKSLLSRARTQLAKELHHDR
jgi:RNA polymerase sigma factor (sigma-70 family)